MKYHGQKITTGIYLFLADDHSTLYRVQRYREYGDLSVQQVDGGERVIKGWFWQVDELGHVPSFYVKRDDNGRIVESRQMVAAPFSWFEQAGVEADFEDIEWGGINDLFPTKKAAVEWLTAQQGKES